MLPPSGLLVFVSCTVIDTERHSLMIESRLGPRPNPVQMRQFSLSNGGPLVDGLAGIDEDNASTLFYSAVVISFDVAGSLPTFILKSIKLLLDLGGWQVGAEGTQHDRTWLSSVEEDTYYMRLR